MQETEIMILATQPIPYILHVETLLLLINHFQLFIFYKFTTFLLLIHLLKSFSDNHLVWLAGFKLQSLAKHWPDYFATIFHIKYRKCRIGAV